MTLFILSSGIFQTTFLHCIKIQLQIKCKHQNFAHAFTISLEIDKHFIDFRNKIFTFQALVVTTLHHLFDLHIEREIFLFHLVKICYGVS